MQKKKQPLRDETSNLLDDADEHEEEEENIPEGIVIEEEEILDDFEITSQLKLNDPVHMYLKEIGRVELLSSQEEINLAKKIEREVSQKKY